MNARYKGAARTNVSDADVLPALPPEWRLRKCRVCSGPLSSRALGFYTPSDAGHVLFACICAGCSARVATAHARAPSESARLRSEGLL